MNTIKELQDKLEITKWNHKTEIASLEIQIERAIIKYNTNNLSIIKEAANVR